MALSDFVDDVLTAFDNNEYTIATFLDLSKAFDTVSHSILLAKLEGVRGVELQWFADYLFGRSVSVNFKNSISSPQNILLSVPQGSSLGPLLFIIYINDIVKISNLIKFTIYADDSVTYISGKNLEQVLEQMNSQLSIVHQWLLANKLTLNIEKTNFMILSRKKIPPDINVCIKINDRILRRVNETIFLDVTLTEKINWQTQINNITKKVSKYNGIIYLLRNILNQQTLKKIYLTLINPHLTYCNILWGSTFKTH